MSSTFDINKHMGPGGVFATKSLQLFQREALVRLGWDEGVEAFHGRLGYLYHVRSGHTAGSPTVDDMLRDWETWAECRFGEGVQ